MYFVKQLIFAFMSTIGFSILFNAPRKNIVVIGLTGSFGWLMYKVSEYYNGLPIASTLIGAITVGIIGEIFARLLKKPATIFIIPGIVPLVPGSGMYYTMYAIIERRFLDAANFGSETLFIAASIATGISISSSFGKVISKITKI